MQVRELQNIEALHSFQLLAGEAGLSNHMKDVVLLEYESLKQKTVDYYQEDFIVTTLFHAKDDPALLLPTVERLIDLRAAGLAIKSVYYPSLPEEVLALCARRQFPVYLFDDLYVEDVILSISDYIRQREEFALFEEPLCTILMEQNCPDIQQLCGRMNPGRQKYMCAVYIHATNPESGWAAAMQNALRMRSARELTMGFRLLQFRRGFFILINDTQSIDPAEAAERSRALLAGLGCMEEELHYGVSGVHQRTEDFDCVIQEAFDALTVAIAAGRRQQLYGDLGCYQLVFSMLRDKNAHSCFQAVKGILETYDRNNGSSCLTGTLRTYAQKGYDIRGTAEALGQHPNTIRYRLKKIGELIGAQRYADEQLYMLGEFLRLDGIRNMIF